MHYAALPCAAATAAAAAAAAAAAVAAAAAAFAALQIVHLSYRQPTGEFASIPSASQPGQLTYLTVHLCLRSACKSMYVCALSLLHTTKATASRLGELLSVALSSLAATCTGPPHRHTGHTHKHTHMHPHSAVRSIGRTELTYRRTNKLNLDSRQVRGILIDSSPDEQLASLAHNKPA